MNAPVKLWDVTIVTYHPTSNTSSSTVKTVEATSKYGAKSKAKRSLEGRRQNSFIEKIELSND